MSDFRHLIRFYENLADEKEQQLFELSTLAMIPISQTNMLAFAKALGMKSPTGKAINAPAFKKIKARFIVAGLWQEAESPLSYSNQGAFTEVPQELALHVMERFYTNERSDRNIQFVKM